jgi:hypothetical protein
MMFLPDMSQNDERVVEHKPTHTTKTRLFSHNVHACARSASAILAKIRSALTDRLRSIASGTTRARVHTMMNPLFRAGGSPAKAAVQGNPARGLLFTLCFRGWTGQNDGRAGDQWHQNRCQMAVMTRINYYTVFGQGACESSTAAKSERGCEERRES